MDLDVETIDNTNVIFIILFAPIPSHDNESRSRREISTSEDNPPKCTQRKISSITKGQ